MSRRRRHRLIVVFVIPPFDNQSKSVQLRQWNALERFGRKRRSWRRHGRGCDKQKLYVRCQGLVHSAWSAAAGSSGFSASTAAASSSALAATASVSAGLVSADSPSFEASSAATESPSSSVSDHHHPPRLPESTSNVRFSSFFFQ